MSFAIPVTESGHRLMQGLTPTPSPRDADVGRSSALAVIHDINSLLYVAFDPREPERLRVSALELAREKYYALEILVNEIERTGRIPINLIVDGQSITNTGLSLAVHLLASAAHVAPELIAWINLHIDTGTLMNEVQYTWSTYYDIDKVLLHAASNYYRWSHYIEHLYEIREMSLPPVWTEILDTIHRHDGQSEESVIEAVWQLLQEKVQNQRLFIGTLKTTEEDLSIVFILPDTI